MAKHQHRSQENLRNLARGNDNPQNNEGGKKKKKVKKGLIVLEGMDCFSAANVIRVIGAKLKKPAAKKCQIITVQSDRCTDVVLNALPDRRFEIVSEGLHNFVTDKRGAVQEIAQRVAADGFQVVA